MADLDGLQRALGLCSAVINHPVAADDRHLLRDRLLVDDLALLRLDVLDHVIGSRSRLGACRQRDADDERGSQGKIDLHLVFSRTETLTVPENMSIAGAVPVASRDPLLLGAELNPQAAGEVETRWKASTSPSPLSSVHRSGAHTKAPGG